MLREILTAIFSCCFQKTPAEATAKIEPEAVTYHVNNPEHVEGVLDDLPPPPAFPAPATPPATPPGPATPPKTSYQQVSKWKNGLENVLNSTYGQECLMAFMEKNGSGNLLKFYLEACDFKEFFNQEQHQWKITERVVEMDRDHWLVLTTPEMQFLRNKIREKQRYPTREMYEEAIRKVYEMIEKGPYLEFVNSGELNDILEELVLADFK